MKQCNRILSLLAAKMCQSHPLLWFAFFLIFSKEIIWIVSFVLYQNLCIHLLGPAILSQASPDTQILIQDSLFMNNVAGSYRLHKNLPDDDFVLVNDDLITLNTTCCLGTLR